MANDEDNEPDPGVGVLDRSSSLSSALLWGIFMDDDVEEDVSDPVGSHCLLEEEEEEEKEEDDDGASLLLPWWMIQE